MNKRIVHDVTDDEIEPPKGQSYIGLPRGVRADSVSKD